MVNGTVNMVTTTCELVNENLQINNTNDILQSENMTVNFDGEVSVVDNEIISVATCMVSIFNQSIYKYEYTY